MYVYKNNLGSNRIGISVGKKIGNSVVRHTFTRRIREIFRKYDQKTISGNDIVIVAGKGSGRARFQELEKSFVSLLRFHGLLKEE